MINLNPLRLLYPSELALAQYLRLIQVLLAVELRCKFGTHLTLSDTKLWCPKKCAFHYQMVEVSHGKLSKLHTPSLLSYFQINGPQAFPT